MGMYFNPGNEGFRSVLAGEYVDKTGMICLINHVIGTKQKLVCVSRPRRFGKSFAAQMLSAYYDCSCDSSFLFQNLSVANDPTYHQYLNQFLVIYLDITNILGKTSPDHVAEFIEKAVTAEIAARYPDVSPADAVQKQRDYGSDLCRSVYDGNSADQKIRDTVRCFGFSGIYDGKTAAVWAVCRIHGAGSKKSVHTAQHAV